MRHSRLKAMEALIRELPLANNLHMPSFRIGLKKMPPVSVLKEKDKMLSDYERNLELVR
jgi:hypothetical protein